MIAEYEAKEKKRKAAEKDEKGKDKDKDKDKDEKEKEDERDSKKEDKGGSSKAYLTPSAPPTPTHNVYTLHRDIYQIRLTELKKKENLVKVLALPNVKMRAAGLISVRFSHSRRTLSPKVCLHPLSIPNSAFRLTRLLSNILRATKGTLECLPAFPTQADRRRRGRPVGRGQARGICTCSTTTTASIFGCMDGL